MRGITGGGGTKKPRQGGEGGEDKDQIRWNRAQDASTDYAIYEVYGERTMQITRGKVCSVAGDEREYEDIGTAERGGVISKQVVIRPQRNCPKAASITYPHLQRIAVTTYSISDIIFVRRIKPSNKNADICCLDHVNAALMSQPQLFKRYGCTTQLRLGYVCVPGLVYTKTNRYTRFRNEGQIRKK